ncbi:uncharacterized protein LOC126834987 [Adelges cooleyi]|uniref:uncharacterized protein LOC126834987 n=1 Tax=Adelges cooleyi TaxID=133065 RepID=UPI00217F9EC3|nr:uncharacterized protein LOC126834987 [Adelges cooleyi]
MMEGGDIFIQDFINDLQESPESQVQKCFRGSNIFITGGTGFVGKVVIEKLLRSCRELNMIYVVARPLNGQTPHERVKEMFTSPLFDRMKIENPGYVNHVQVICGDCASPNIGIAEEDLRQLSSKINVVIHLASIAANSNCTLRSAIYTNVRATIDLVVLAKRFPNLKAFIHISSVFAHHGISEVHEQFYSFPMPVSTLVHMAETIPDHVLNRLSTGLLSEWPDVVTYTKAVSEQVIRSAGHDFPACIIRPGFVLGTANEPIAGWTNHLNNLTGCALGSGLGLVRIFHGPNVNADIVPVDMLVNLILAACWDIVGTMSDVVNQEVPRDNKEMIIYNYVSSNYKCCTWKQLGEKFFKSEKRVSSPNNYCSLPLYFVTGNTLLYWVISLFLHTIPGNVVDTYLWVLGKEPRLNEFYKRVHVSAKHLNAYQQMRLKCYNQNVFRLMNKLSARDKILFCFDINTLSWHDYFDRYVRGLQVYLMGNRLHRTASNRTIKRLITIHYNFIIFIFSITILYFMTEMTAMIDKSQSEIQQFFAGANVFITGSTGFVGSVLLEKILRACSVKHVYLLVRQKKGKNANTRLNEMFSMPLYNRLRSEQPEFIDKVSLINGDCEEPNLGLSPIDEEYIIRNMHIIIHCAATINLNGSLKRTTFINVRSTRDLLLIARRISQLKSFVYVSTAFVNPNQEICKEIIYDCHISGDTLIKMAETLPESLMDSITNECLGTWPNTYTLSKCVAENLVKQYGENMPICIARPSIVVFTKDEPMAGWFTSMKSVPGLCLGVGLGVVRVVLLDNKVIAPIVPADKVANFIITSAWHASKRRQNSLISVFTFVPNNTQNPLTYAQCLENILNAELKNKIHSEKQVWYPNITLTKSETLYKFLFFCYHYIPAFFVDIILRISGKEFRVVPLCTKLYTMTKEMQYFSTGHFAFDDQNLKTLIKNQSAKDKILFDMDITLINWDTYLLEAVYGVRRSVLNELDSTIPAAVKRHQKIMIAYYVVNGMIYTILFYIAYFILKYVLKCIF